MAPRNAKPIDAGIVARVAQGLRYAVSGVAPDSWFGPNQPMQPVAPPSVAGRQFDFPTGYNLQTKPRSNDAISFAELRALADSYDLLRLVIETRKDQIERLDWAVQVKDADKNAAKKKSATDPRIAEVTALLERPDQEHDFATWTRALLEDLLVIDAPTIYPRPNRGGGIYGFELIDGATIKRVLDDGGRTPAPPSPAYQQILKGLPAVDYARDELIYMPRNQRTNRVYGFSPVEQIVLTVNMALRRQKFTLDYFTEGSIPDALGTVPDDWTVEQIKAFQTYWDSLFEGNAGARRRMKFVPGKFGLQGTKEPELTGAFDEWLARVVCFAFSIPPTAFVKQVNRATAEQADASASEEGLEPLKKYLKRVIDTLIQKFLGYRDLEFVWRRPENEDPKVQSEIDDKNIRNGSTSIDEVRARRGEDPIGMGPAVFTASGVVLIKDILNPPEPVAAPDPKADPAAGDEPNADESGVGKRALTPFALTAPDALKAKVEEKKDDHRELLLALLLAYASQWRIRFYEVLGETVPTADLPADIASQAAQRATWLIDQINATTVKELSAAIAEAKAERRAATDAGTLVSDEDYRASLRKKLTEVFDRADEARAPLIGTTETTASGGLTSFITAVQDDIDELVWTTMGDQDVRTTHQLMDGQTRAPGEMFDSPAGGQALFPGGFGIAAEDAHCRCWLVPLRIKKALDAHAELRAAVDAFRRPLEERGASTARQIFNEQRDAVLTAFA